MNLLINLKRKILAIWSLLAMRSTNWLHNPKVDPNFGPCGGFDIWHGSSCKSGHFWGSMSDWDDRKGEFTEKKITEKLIAMCKGAKIEYNWDDKEYKRQLHSNLRNNDLLQYYKKHYTRELRKQKLEKINKS